MQTRDIKQIIDIAHTFQGYDSEPKATFHRLAKKYLEEIARLMKLTPGTYEVRTNKAGVAVLGEVTLHSETIYVQFGGSIPHMQFYYRTVKGRKDFTGGTNTWMHYTRLEEMQEVADALSAHIRRNLPRTTPAEVAAYLEANT